MRVLRDLRAGARAALPISLAYLPVAFALGAASSRLGFSTAESALWSFTMFSGANQALMLSSLSSGVPLLVIAALCIAASLRHLLYGLALAPRISASPVQRSVFGYGLTDEVFATALTAGEGQSGPLRGPWLIALGLTVLLVWVAGTGVGNAAGDALQAFSPHLTRTLDFALPALFLSLVLATARQSLHLPMLLAAGIAALLLGLDRQELAVPLAALAALLPRRRTA